MASNYKKKMRTKYTKEALKEAMAAINAGMPILAASAKYQIPRSTLHNKKHSKNIDKKPGPETCLTADQEETLVQWVFDCSNIGMPIARQHLQNSVPLLLKGLKRNTQFTNGRRWYKNFLQRHDKVVERISKNNAILQAAATEGGIRNWFANVERYLQEKSLVNIHPSRVFSSDTLLLTSSSVQMTGNAGGRLTSPMIVFSQQSISVNTKISETMPPGWMIGKSENGSVTAENFYEYIQDCFHPWLVSNNIEFPVVLLLNGRVPHVTLLLTDFCAQHKIELIALHPNSSNLMNPMEALFSPLRVAWEQYCKITESAVLVGENVAPVLKSTLDTLNVTEFLTKGFASCGLYPLSVDSVNFKMIPERQSDKVQRERVEFAPYVSTANRKPVKQKSNLTDEQFLQMFEQQMDPNTLQAFKCAQQSRVWTGRKEDTTLFYFWKDAMNRALNSCGGDSPDSRLNSTENHANFHDIGFDNMNTFLEDKNQLEDTTEDPLEMCSIEMEEQ